MSDKFGIKGNMIVFDPNITDWFEFENKVLKEISNNKYHTVNAVCEFKQYVGTDIMGSFKLKGDECTWVNFAILVIAKKAEYRDWSMSCTVTLKARRKGKMAEAAIDEGLDIFATTRVDSTLDVYEKNKELIDGMYQAGKRSEDDESDEEVEGDFISQLKETVNLETGEVG